jgi:hypothetical protein
MAFYTYPPSGSVAGSAAVPAAGLNVDFSWRAGRLLNITLVCFTGTCVFQYWDHKDTPIAPITLTAGTNYHQKNRPVQRFTLTGTATVALILNDPPTDTDPAVLAIGSTSGAVSVVLNYNILSGGPIPLYQVPPAFKATLLRVFIKGIASQTIDIQVRSGSGYLVDDWGTLTIPTSTILTAAQDSLASIVLYDYLLLTQDTLEITTSGAITISLQVLQEPL